MNPNEPKNLLHTPPFQSRRRFLRSASLGAAAATTAMFFDAPGAFAEELTRTPPQTEGPFYPVDLPLDTDNDLLLINDQITPAVGEVTHLSGRILDEGGAPIRNALVEIWQVDNNGAYLHKGSDNREKWDNNFQGFGRFLTGSTGEYYFRTIKPVPYPGRTPHIHFAIKRPGHEKFSTQCYIKGHAGNPKDGIWKGIANPKAKENVTVDFAPIKDSRAGELAANFNVVLGRTPKG